MPYFEDPDMVNTAIADARAGTVSLPEKPESWFFPRAVFVSGPLHIVWNAFESAIKKSPHWEKTKESLAGILAFLGHAGLRGRFVEVCLTAEDDNVKHLFQTWRHKMVDWKWEYMEDAFQRLTPIVGVFLARFSAQKIKQPVGQEDGTCDGLDAKCIDMIERTRADRVAFSAVVESLCVFAQAVGRESRWLGGCRCHDWIWRLKDTSAKEKLRLFQKDVGCLATECCWRGRRASDLARGSWKNMIVRVGGATSRELHRRLTPLLPARRAQLLDSFQALRTSWCEEIGSKFAYWDELPHLCLGMYPNDSESQVIARRVQEKKAAHPADAHTHRVTRRLLFDVEAGFGAMVKALADDGVMAPELEAELEQANMVSTCEQRVEEIHAKIYQIGRKAGGPVGPPTVSARLRFSETMDWLDDWRVMMFVAHLWGRRNLVKSLLSFSALSGEFLKVATRKEQIRAVYHYHPRQLFVKINEEKYQHVAFKDVTTPAVLQLIAPMKMVVDYLKDRLTVGTLFSLPPCCFPGELEIVVLGEAPEPFNARTLIPTCLALAQAASPPAPRIGARFSSHKFYKVINTSMNRRFLQHTAATRLLALLSRS